VTTQRYATGSCQHKPHFFRPLRMQCNLSLGVAFVALVQIGCNYFMQKSTTFLWHRGSWKHRDQTMKLPRTQVNDVLSPQAAPGCAGTLILYLTRSASWRQQSWPHVPSLARAASITRFTIPRATITSRFPANASTASSQRAYMFLPKGFCIPSYAFPCSFFRVFALKSRQTRWR
jgi:hypothetical protein